MDTHEGDARRRRLRLLYAGLQEQRARTAVGRLLDAIEEQRWQDDFVAGFTRSRERAAAWSQN
jgi:hypothetical protein